MAGDGSNHREWGLQGFECPAEATGKLCKSQGRLGYTWPSDLLSTEGDTFLGEALWPEPGPVVQPTHAK